MTKRTAKSHGKDSVHAGGPAILGRGHNEPVRGKLDRGKSVSTKPQHSPIPHAIHDHPVRGGSPVEHTVKSSGAETPAAKGRLGGSSRAGMSGGKGYC